MTPADFAELRILVRLDAQKRAARNIGELSACRGKHRYASFTQAKVGISLRLRGVVHPYHCWRCNGFHLGSVAEGRKKRLSVARRVRIFNARESAHAEDSL